MFKLFLIWLAGVAVLVAYVSVVPDVSQLRSHNPRSTTLMELRRLQARKAKLPYQSKMTWKNLDAISPHLAHAVLIAEDDRFYEHHGFDLNEIREAVKINWQKKRYAYGGSTITQQLARTLYLSPQKNLIRKLREAILTYRLERTLSKKRILELYLNVVEWGSGVYGAEAAAQTYFGISSENLTPDEAIALASILPSPRRWSPLSEKSFMARRRTQLLDRMQRAGYLPTEPTSASVDLYFLPPTQGLNELQSGGMQHQAPQSLDDQ